MTALALFKATHKIFSLVKVAVFRGGKLVLRPDGMSLEGRLLIGDKKNSFSNLLILYQGFMWRLK